MNNQEPTMLFNIRDEAEWLDKLAIVSSCLIFELSSDVHKRILRWDLGSLASLNFYLLMVVSLITDSFPAAPCYKLMSACASISN